MKFTIPCSELQKALSTVGGVILTRTTDPMLENFLFEVAKDSLKITATDLDTTMSIVVKVKDASDGKVAIPSRRLTETVRALPSMDIVFDISGDNRITMTTGNGVYKLTGEPSEKFNTPPSFKGSVEVKISDENLSRLIGKTSFAVSNDDLRPAMMGIYFQIKKNDIRAVATDGHRLVRIISAGVAEATAERDIIVPAKAMNLVVKSISTGESTISFSDTHVMFSRDGVTLVSRMIDEKYPNYESVIPLENDKQLTVNRNELIASVRRTAVYASSTTHQVRFALKKNSLTVSAEDIDFGTEAKETIKCDYTSDAMEIGFNSAYIVDILSHMDNEEVMMMFSSPTRASIVKPVDQRNGENLLMLVMPVRLNN